LEVGTFGGALKLTRSHVVFCGNYDTANKDDELKGAPPLLLVGL
jgi:hypothetical protein